MPPATLVQFAQVNDAAAATSSKLKKTAILAEYLRALGPDDLPLAVWYAAGWAFGENGRVLNVGGAIVSDVALDLLRLTPHEYYDLVRKSGEIGEALAQAWNRIKVSQPPSDSLTLQGISIAFDDLSRTGLLEIKRAILKDLFSRCRDPREAAYLAKIIFGEMRTGVQTGVLQAAIAQAFEKTLPQIQRAQLLVGDLGKVALLAKDNALDSARFQLFHPIQFMLATPQETPADALKTMACRAFFVEDKLDGIRAQVHKSGDRLVIYTRTMGRADEAFPDVADALRNVPGEFLLDGEIVPYCDGCVLPFAHIQKRLGRKVLTQRLMAENPAIFIAFDILYRDGRLLMDEPLSRRREILNQLCCPSVGQPLHSGSSESSLASTRPLATAVHLVSAETEITAAFEQARSRRNEGIILKDPDSAYSPGRRGQAWLKIKTHLPTLDCVVTAAEFGHGKRRHVLSDYTFAVWDREPADPDASLVNIGKAYSGVSDEEIAQLTELFLKLSRQQLGRVHLVEPQVVLEIACDQIQESARHASGYAMRFPRIKRVRWDKLPADADRLARVHEIYQSASNTAFAPSRVAPKVEEPTLFDHLA